MESLSLGGWNFDFQKSAQFHYAEANMGRGGGLDLKF